MEMPQRLEIVSGTNSMKVLILLLMEMPQRLGESATIGESANSLNPSFDGNASTASPWLKHWDEMARVLILLLMEMPQRRNGRRLYVSFES